MSHEQEDQKKKEEEQSAFFIGTVPKETDSSLLVEALKDYNNHSGKTTALLDEAKKSMSSGTSMVAKLSPYFSAVEVLKDAKIPHWMTAVGGINKEFPDATHYIRDQTIGVPGATEESAQPTSPENKEAEKQVEGGGEIEFTEEEAGTIYGSADEGGSEIEFTDEEAGTIYGSVKGKNGTEGGEQQQEIELPLEGTEVEKNPFHHFAEPWKKPKKYILYSKPSREQRYEVGHIFSHMGTDPKKPSDLSLVKVLKVFLGPDRDLHRIEVVNPSPIMKGVYSGYKGPLYIESAACSPLPGIPDLGPISAKGASSEHGYPWPFDWKELGPISVGEWCYLEERQQMYYARLYQPGLRKQPVVLEGGSSWESQAEAVIELPDPNKGYEGAKYDIPEPPNEKPFKSLEEFKKHADKKAILRRGASQILKFYGKVNWFDEPPVGLLDELVNMEMVEIPPEPYGFHKDPRTDTLDVAVVMRSAFLDVLPQYIYTDEDLKTHFSNTEGYSYSFAYNTLQAKIDFIVKHCTERAEELKPKFKKPANQLLEVAKYLSSFSTKFKRFILLNGVKESELDNKDPYFELGFSKEFRLTYVLMGEEDKRSTPLTIGLPMLLSSNNMPSPAPAAAHHFLYSFKDMEKTVQDPALTAIDFAQKYYYPVTAIIFKPTESPAEDNPRITTPAEVQAASVSKHKDVTGVGKSTSQLLKEKHNLDNTDRKIQISNSREKENEFTGDNIVEDIDFLKSKVKDADGVYAHVLNKTSIKELGAIALSATTKDFNFEDQQKMLIGSVISKATGAQIEEMASIVQEKYPNEYSKAVAKELSSAQEYFETTGKPKEGTIPPSVKNLDGTINEIKLARAMEAEMSLAEWHKNIQSPKKSSGQQISEQMEPEQRQQMRYFSGFDYGSGLKFGEGYTLPAIDGSLSESSTIGSPTRKAEVLKRLANNPGDEFKISTSILEKIILPVVPSAVVRNSLSQYMGNINNVMEEVQTPPSLNELAPPTVTLPDNSFTSDPTPGVVETVVEGVREAIAKALIATVTMVLDRVKKSVADSIGEKFGGLIGKIPPELISAAFESAGVPPGFGAEFFDNLVKQATVSEMEELLTGSPSEEASSLAMITAGMTPGMFSYMPNISNALVNLSETIDPDIFRKAREAETEDDDAAWSGLLCDEEDDDSPLDPLEKGKKERDRDLANRLLDLIDGANNLLSDIPSTISDCGEQGLVSRDPPSMRMANKLALDTIFESVEMAFSQDSVGFIDSLLLKKTRDAQKGDPDWIPTYGDNLGIDQMTGTKIDPKPTKAQAVAYNKKNSKIEVSVIPSLKENLQDFQKKNFKIYSDYYGDAEEGQGITSITMKGSVNVTEFEIPVNFALEEAAFAAADAQVKNINQKILDIKMTGLDFDLDALEYVTKDLEEAGKLWNEAKDNLDAAHAAAAKKLKEKPVLLSSKGEQLLLGYSMNWADVQYSGVVDQYAVRIGEIPEQYILVDTVRAPSDNLDETKKYKILPSSTNETGVYRTAQSQAFANYITNRFTDAGFTFSGIPEDFEMSTGFQECTLNWEQMFFRLFKKTAQQASLSELYELENLLEISLSKKYEKSLCAPDPEAFDLLAISETKEEVQDDYEQSCKPSNESDESGSPFEESALSGVLKVYLRLCVAEVLLRSMPIYSQFNSEEVFEDGVFMDYVVTALRRNLENSDPDFFSRLKKQAEVIVTNKSKNGELKNIYNINDMLLLEELDHPGIQEKRADAAFKYIVLEQAADLSYKLQEALGTSPPKIYTRFLNNGGEPEPFNVVAPRASLNSGWIRTIPAPKSSTSGIGDQRFIGKISDKEKLLKGTTSKKNTQAWWDGALTYDLGRLKYPDLEMNGGTFVLEKYIRVEDLDNLPEGISDTYGFRKRSGGPDALPDIISETLDEWGKTTPHLSGVVNISAFQSYLDKVFEKHSEDVNIADFFKPLKYGMRLMWIPPTNKNFKPRITWLTEKQKINGEIQETSKAKKSTDLSGFESLGLSPSKTAAYKAIFAGSNLDDNITNSIQIGSQTDIENSLKDTFKELSAQSAIAKKEKAFCIVEKDIIDSELFLEAEKQIGESKEGFYHNQKYSRGYSKEFFPIPLVTVERAIEASTLKKARKVPYAEEYFRGLVENTDEFKFLFKYVFSLPRMLSLLTIYNSESVIKNSSDNINAFNGTKEALRNLFYTLDVEEGDMAPSWWQEEGILEEEDKDAVPELKRQESNLSPFSAPGLTAMAMRTVPLLVRGYAEYNDPHYKFVSSLTDRGILPTGKTWKSVPFFWPSNWLIPGTTFPGWGPPIGTWGIAAYSMPELPGDRKSRTESKIQKATENEMIKQDITGKTLNCDEEEK